MSCLLRKSFQGSATCRSSTWVTTNSVQLPAEVWANLFSGLSNLQEVWTWGGTQLQCSCLLKSGPICFQGSATCRSSTWNDNKLSELPAEVFSGLSNLQDLDLRSNSLGQLPAEVWANLFSGLSKLQKLDLEWNNLSELPAEVFSGLSNLQDLDLECKLAWAVAC